jgi:hypothetical protein
MRMADKSWANAKPETIFNCFKACGFVKEETEPEVFLDEENKQCIIQ